MPLFSTRSHTGAVHDALDLDGAPFAPRAVGMPRSFNPAALLALRTALPSAIAFAAKVPDGLRAAIDLLVEVPEGDARSSLFRLKDYPKTAAAAAIKEDIVRLRLIEELLAGGANLDEVDPKIVTVRPRAGRMERRPGPADHRSRVLLPPSGHMRQHTSRAPQ
jgi:hypothetical protein